MSAAAVVAETGFETLLPLVSLGTLADIRVPAVCCWWDCVKPELAVG